MRADSILRRERLAMSPATALKGLAAIPLSDITPSPSNIRERIEDVDELALSIREVGLLQPIVVQQIPGARGYQIVAGHRRYAAVRRLKWATVPCIIRRDMLPDEELLAMLAENGQRSGLDPIEEARALRRLIQTGKSAEDVARLAGRRPSWVTGRLMLLQLPEPEQEEVRAGHYSITHATNLVRAQRVADRARLNPVSRPVGRPKGAKTKPYFGDTHPLARTARAVCDHRGSPKVGGVACGPCWESVIRADTQGDAADG